MSGEALLDIEVKREYDQGYANRLQWHINGFTKQKRNYWVKLRNTKKDGCWLFVL
jgi:hypothetical protein